MRKYHYYNLFAFVILVLTTFMSIGYSAISTNLKISGDVAFYKAADIRVTSASLNGVTNSGAQTTPVSFDYTSISGAISLPNLNSTVTITVNTKNYVALDKEISSITNTTFSNSNIEYTISGYRLGDKILGNATTTFTITFKYKDTVTTVPSTKTLNYKLTFNFNNYILNMMIGNTGKSNADAGYNWLGGSINSLKIEKISFTTSNSVPSNALGSWDVSVKQNGSIKAWYFDSDSDSKYEIVIGSSDGAVLASDLTYYTYYLKYLENFNAANLNISNVNSLAYMFSYSGYSVGSYTVSNISSWDTSGITNMSNLFSNAGHDATSWNAGSFENWNVSNVTNMSGMFLDACYTATTWTGGTFKNWDVSKVTNMQDLFEDLGYKTTTFKIDVTSWNTGNVTNMYDTFNCIGRNATTWSIGTLTNWNVSKVTTMRRMFYYAGNNAISWSVGNLSGWNTSKVTTMDSMFYYSGYNLTSSYNLGDLSNWDTSNVTSMSKMFAGAGYNASSWYVGTLSSWNTGKVTKMDFMFSAVAEKASSFVLNLANWDTSNVIDMKQMFYYVGFGSTCKTFNVGNLSNWNTGKVTTMYRMFYYAGGIGATTWYVGNLSNWDVSNVTDMSGMFDQAGSNATSVSIGSMTNWNMSKVTDVSGMFDYFGGGSSATINLGTITLYNVTAMNGFMMNCNRCNATINLRGNPSSYNQAFWNTSEKSGKVTVNYTSATTNIDAIIATKSSRSNVVKGSLIS